MGTIKKLEGLLDFVLFVATLSLIIYGLTKGFNLIELSTNVTYLMVMLLRYALTLLGIIFKIE